MFTKTKSREPDLFFIKQLTHKVDIMMKEQVEQRKDLSIINALLKSLMADIGIQKQVDDYFEKDTTNDNATSPQTEQMNIQDQMRDMD